MNFDDVVLSGDPSHSAYLSMAIFFWEPGQIESERFFDWNHTLRSMERDIEHSELGGES